MSARVELDYVVGRLIANNSVSTMSMVRALEVIARELKMRLVVELRDDVGGGESTGDDQTTGGEV